MKKIYVLTQGSYSDYSIVGIFSTRQKAEEFRTLVKPGYDGYNDLEEWTLDPDAPEKIRHGYSIWNVTMLRDGTVEDSSVRDLDYYNVSRALDPPYIWERAKAPYYRGKGVPNCLDAAVWAKSRTHAIKIVNEYRAQFIANNKWPE